ncbi:alpha/beta hydrolase [Mobilicoccus pelagius]|uniref:Xaa-Pro dipeptidyl-peptidase-like domain-containing protein n=1 Tax=Mobilicoccus pelagius NBRC 104925 TaxID=1089455 RepID=H5UMH7_9MICO|nr:CocE/NonD family hydrolase [Mobilicoccus pelagius]GAB46935.1 hypothetical protein MOPEL_001_00530 [Mobilicoccus pelagius NBRC 104925]
MPARRRTLSTTPRHDVPGRGHPWRGLLLGAFLCLVSMVGASLVQTDMGRVDITDMRWQTGSGRTLSGLLLVPEGASPEDRRPAVVTTHGWYNTKEMQDLNYVELARRGYVVLALDMYGHGNSDDLVGDDYQTAATGMSDAVEFVSTLPYVDTGRIGITGHSNGARASDLAVRADNARPTHLVRSVLLVGNDATYVDDAGRPTDVYGDRAAGVVAAQYDEFFFRTRRPDGTVTPPRDYIHQPTAQSFLAFGTTPSEEREAGTLYRSGDRMRVVYTPDQIHPWNHFSKEVVGNVVDFFDASLGAPRPLPAGDQTWQWKAAFNALGLVGFALVLYNLVLVLLETPFFASLRAVGPVRPLPAPRGAARGWFWGTAIAGVVFSIASYLVLFPWAMTSRPGWLHQAPSFYIGCWALATGLFTAFLLALSWWATGRRSGVGLRERGLVLSWRDAGRTILLAVLAVAGAYATVFLANWLFHTDYRLWVLTMKAFDADKLPIALSYLPFLAVFYVVNSVAINSFNFVEGRRRGTNLALLALLNVLPVLVILAVQYGWFYTHGLSFTESFLTPPLSNIIGIWLFPLVVYFPAAAVLDRLVYRRTRNPYLGGLVMALVLTLVTVTNTLTLT